MFMEFRNVLMFFTIAIVMMSSACSDLNSGDSSGSQEIVNNGNILKYQSQGEKVQLVFYNETNERIGMSMIGEEKVESYRINKVNGMSADRSTQEIFFGVGLSKLPDDKVKRLMTDGEKITVSRNSVTANISRSRAFDYRDVEAYNVTVEDPDEIEHLTVNVKKPYIYLKSPEDFEYVSMNYTSSPEKYISDKLSTRIHLDESLDYECNTAVETLCSVVSSNDQVSIPDKCIDSGSIRTDAIPYEIKNAPETEDRKVICN